ncbi:hypothetical protein ACP4OV_007172 [Aristida adscensionis]
MATTSLLMVPITLCFFLLVLQAQARDENLGVRIDINGEARCKINPSMLIRNASLDLVIGSTRIPGAGGTTETGRIVLTANLTSGELLDTVLSNSNKTFVVAPPDSCGTPKLPAGAEVAAPLQLTAVITEKTSGSEATAAVSGQLAIATSDGLLTLIRRVVAAAGDFACLDLIPVILG